MDIWFAKAGAHIHENTVGPKATFVHKKVHDSLHRAYAHFTVNGAE
jgi:hypothetical protein